MNDIVKKFYAANPVFRTGKMSDKGYVMTPMARASYAFGAFKPGKPPGAAAEQEKKYSITLLFPEDADLTLLQNAINKAAEGLFGHPSKWPRKSSGELMLSMPIYDQGDKAGDVYVPGAKYISPGKKESKGRPGIIDASGQPITDESKLYSGCWVWATVNPYAYKEPKQGVGLGLVNIQKLGDDEPLGYTAPAATDEFQAIEVPLTGDALQAASAENIFS